MKPTLPWIQYSSIGFAFLVGASIVSTQDVPTQAKQPPTLQFALPAPPEDPGAPSGRRRGGSSRGDIQAANCTNPASCTPLLTALVPETEKAPQEKTGKAQQKKFVWGLTSAERPSFWFVIPEGEQAPVEFILQNKQNGYTHRVEFPLPKMSAGLVQLSLPDDIPPLELNKRYFWTLAIGATSSQPQTYVQGSIYRVPLTTTVREQIDSATGLEQVSLYAQNGLWHDAVMSLAKLRQAAPDDPQLTRAWTELLKQINLEDIAAYPLLPCCTTESQTASRTLTQK